MNSLVLGRRLRLVLLLKPCVLKSNGMRKMCCFTKTNTVAYKGPPNVVNSKHFLRTACDSSVKKAKDKTNETTNEATENSDNELQSILNDFAKDFGLNNESQKTLENIKKSLDKPAESLERPSYQLVEDDAQKCVDNEFKDFSDSDSVVFHSSEEIISGACDLEDKTFHIDQTRELDLSERNVKRGIYGVYDVHELVDFLRKENLLDIAVISIPKWIHYADFLVLATAKSPRHSKAVSEHVIKLYKMKKHVKDPFIIVEGEKVSDWKALDMGNIVLHIFLEETRAFYDIESLWLFDSDYDSGGLVKKDPVFDAIQEQMAFFNAMQDTPLPEDGKEAT